MTIPLPGNRLINVAAFFATMVTIGIVLYMEHAMLLTPCGLCITQRVFILLCGLTCLASAIHNPETRGQKRYAFGAASMCIFGSYFAARQIWLQHLPEDQVPTCGPGLGYLYQNFPFIEVLNFLLQGDGNCAEVQFRLLGLSIPEMSLLAFAALLGTCLYVAFRQLPQTA